MKNILLSIFLAIYAFIVYSSCASQQPVMGGPKDTIPPTLLESYPTNKSLNFKDQQVTLTFDESIKEDQIKTKLIITPDDQNKFDVTIRKYSITLDFENPFKDSTTYTLNFNNTISDITENNESENVILAFSTTNYIDSLTITGQIIDLLTQQPVPDATVALYLAKDTTDIFNKRPLYFTKTTEEGTYSIENLKNGSYRIYSFLDKNKNNLCESNDEPHGFIADTLQLSQNLDSLTIPITRNDVRPLASLNTRTSGSYFESRYNKPLKDFTVEILDTTQVSNWDIQANLTSDARGIIFYPGENPRKDSVKIAILSFDSTFNTISDTTFLKFVESRRNKPAFTFTYKPSKDEQVLEKSVFELNFSKPIKYETINDSLQISIDTIYQQKLQVDSILWEKHNTKLTIHTKLDKTLITRQKLANAKLTDSLAVDTAAADYKQAIALKGIWQTIPDNYIRVKIPKGTFFSVDNDSSQAENIPLQFINPEERGIIRGTITTENINYTLQLIDSKYRLVMTHEPSPNFQFSNVPPGEYTFRVLIDDNEDGTWSTGNSLLRIEPESVYIYPEIFNVRPNWTQENIDIIF